MPTPTLAPYYGNLKTETQYRIQAKIIAFYDTVGSGSFSILSPDEMAFQGSYSAAGQHGSVNLYIKVTSDNKGIYTNNGHSSPCTFKVDGDYLYVYFKEGGGPTNVQLEWWDDGLWIGGDAVPHDIWVGPY